MASHDFPRGSGYVSSCDPSGLRPGRRGRERFVDREHSVHRVLEDLDVEVSIVKFVHTLGYFFALRCQGRTKYAIC